MGKRRVGIELEFSGLSPKETAQVVLDELGGDIKEENDDLVFVETSLGKFQAETDAKFLKKLSEASKEHQKTGEFDYDGWLRKILKSVSDELVPTELVCPPIQIEEIPKVTNLHQALAKKGAKGTFDSLRFAFGAQLNPEVLDPDAGKILKVFKSFIMLSDWLKAQINIDPTRIISSFAGDFSKAYQQKIFDENYRPDMNQLIDEYLEYNPTRNRSLDMLPLFKHIDQERVEGVIKDELVKSRPTYHYRLPNCQIDLKSWTIEVEWRRWQLVEKLAQHEFFEDVEDLHRKSLSKKIQFSSSARIMELNNYIERLRA